MMNCPICRNTVNAHSAHMPKGKAASTFYYYNDCRLDFDLIEGRLFVIPNYPKTRLEDFAVWK